MRISYVIECKLCEIVAHPLPVKDYAYREVITCSGCGASEELHIITKAHVKELDDEARRNVSNLLNSQPPQQGFGATFKGILDDGGDFLDDRVGDCPFVLVKK